MFAEPFPLFFVASSSSVKASRFTNDVPNHTDSVVDEDIIMSEASRHLSYGSSTCFGTSSAFVSPHDITIEQIVDNQSQRLTIVQTSQPQPALYADVNEASRLLSHKRRTRRANTKPIEKGNNPFGHLGKLRCVQCRAWRQKCDYVALELPCAQCAKKGLKCGKADKVWGRKRRIQESNTGLQIRTESAIGDIENSCVDLIGFIVPPPEDERISSFEELCISYYFNKDPKWSTPRMASCILHRYGLNVASKAVRYSIVLNYIRFLRNQDRNVADHTQELEYLGQVYRHTQVAIEQNKFLDVVYTCHHLCQYLYLSASPVAEIAKHSLGFFASLKHLQETVKLDTSEKITVVFMYCILGDILCGSYRRDPNAANARIALEALTPAALTFTSPFYTYAIPPELSSSATLFLSSHLHFLLFENTRFHAPASFEDSIREVVHGPIDFWMRELYNVIPRHYRLRTMIQEQLKFCNPTRPAIFSTPSVIPNPSDSYWVSSHCKLHFLSVLFGFQSTSLGGSDIETALLACRMWFFVGSQQWREHPVFWSPAAQALFLAGLFLAKTEFLDGTNTIAVVLVNLIVTDYVREQIQEMLSDPKCLRGQVSDGVSVASLVVPFFNEACRLPCLSQITNLQFKGIEGIMHFLSLWPVPWL